MFQSRHATRPSRSYVGAELLVVGDQAPAAALRLQTGPATDPDRATVAAAVPPSATITVASMPANLDLRWPAPCLLPESHPDTFIAFPPPGTTEPAGRVAFACMAASISR